MNRPVDVLPAKAWVCQESDTSDIQLYHPYAIPTLPGVNARRPMGTYNKDGRANTPPELRRAANLKRGFDFWDMVRDSGATAADITINLVLAEARSANDLGHRGTPTAYESMVRRSAMSVYGLNGSIVREEAAERDAELAGVPFQQGYYGRIRDAVADADRLRNCDPLDDGQGGPASATEQLITKVAHEVIELGRDVTDQEGTARYFADMVYLDQVQWYAAGRVGDAAHEAWEQNKYHAIGEVTVALPAEELAIYHKFQALGAPAVNLCYATPEINPDNNAEMNMYGLIIHDGVIPAELLS